MPLLTIFLLLATCLPIHWPQSSLGFDPVESTIAMAIAVIVPLAIAFVLRSWVVASLRGDPMRRSEVGQAYLRLRTLLFYFNLACVVLAILGLGWGFAVQSIFVVERGNRLVLAPFAELLVPLPYFLILLGTWLIYFDAERALQQASISAARPFWTRAGFVLHNARQVVLFLMLPVILFAANQSLARWWPDVGNTTEFRIASTATLLAVVIFLPVAVAPLLGLTPLPDGPTRDRLSGLSQRIGFRFRNLFLWPTRGGMVNAMILGLFPRIRYVIFTDRILEELPPQQLDAVLGHEAGHARHGHLHYYLIFLLLSLVALSCVGMYAIEWIEPSENFPDAAEYWFVLPPFVIIPAYLFVVFGMLSRRCERQADVFGAWAISCGDPNCIGHDRETIFPHGSWKLCPTGLRTMADTLEHVHLLNGYGVDHPKGPIRSLWVWFKNWAHGPIPRRTAYLMSLIDRPDRERRLQWGVAIFRWGLLAALAAVIIIFGELVGWDTVAKAM